MTRPVRAALAALLVAPLARAGDVYVDPVHGDDANPGTAPALAWRTIHRAVEVLGESGDVIHLAPGTYSTASGETFPIRLRGQYLRGDQGAAATVLQGGPITLETHRLFPTLPPWWAREVRGVTLRGASDRALSCTALSLHVVDCVIEASGTGVSTGNAFTDSGLALERVTIRQCDVGLVVWPVQNGSWVRTSGCTIFGNWLSGIHLPTNWIGAHDVVQETTVVADNSGDGLWRDTFFSSSVATRLRVDSCLFARNGGDGLRIEGRNVLEVTLRSTTVAHNSGTGLHLQPLDAAPIALAGVISHGNTIEYAASATAVVTASYCDVPGAPFVGANGNIAADPLFVVAPDDLRLRFGNPCADAGDPAGTFPPRLGRWAPPIDGDLDAQERIDMGCYELAPLDLVTSGAIGTPLRLELWGANGSTATVECSRLAPVAPTVTPFGEYDLAPSSHFVLFTSAVAPGPPVVFARPIPANRC